MPRRLPRARHLALCVLGIAATAAAAPAQPGNAPRGLPLCPNPLSDSANCYLADLTLPALDSTTTPGARRVADNFVATTTNPTRICWLGRYAGGVVPPAPNERFQIRIFHNAFGTPDQFQEPIFTRVFELDGTPGTDQLEMSCLDGGNCPSVDPASGGHWVYSAQLAGGFPISADECYWIEIANVGSAAAGVTWAWSASSFGAGFGSMHSVDGDYDFCDRNDTDRAICVSGGIDPFADSCFLGLIPPPICQLDNANGQPPIGVCDLTGPRIFARSSSPGSVGGPTWHPALHADNFQFAQNQSVSSLCFFGAWHCPLGDDLCVPPVTASTWDIVYYADAGGVPGQEIASFRVGTTPGVTYLWDGSSITSVDHPPVSFQAGVCYWLSVGRVQRGDGMDVQWAWERTTAGAVGDGTFATNVNGHWFRASLPGPGGADLSNFAFLLGAGPVAPPACEPRDCNLNSTPDADEIAADPALDCFAPSGPLGSMGGADGALDMCQCVSNWNRDCCVNSSDISAYLTSWLAAVVAHDAAADIDCSGTTNSSDISAFLTIWVCAIQCAPPFSGCP